MQTKPKPHGHGQALFLEAPAPEYTAALSSSPAAAEFAALLGTPLRASPAAAAFASLLGQPLLGSAEQTGRKTKRVVRKTWCVECGNPACSVRPVTREFEVDD